jgi:methylmalonyl-CoA/ethylmalonyl-CoA epimerase
MSQDQAGTVKAAKVTKVPYIAVAVKNREAAGRYFVETFGAKIITQGTVAEESYRDALVEIGNFHLYLMEPMEEDSVIGRFLAKKGEGIHHLCFSFSDLGEAIKDLRQKRLRILDRNTDEFAFIHPSDAHGVLIELAPENQVFRTE